MCWSLLTKGITASPQKRVTFDAGDGKGTEDGDPGTESPDTELAGCDITANSPNFDLLLCIFKD